MRRKSADWQYGLLLSALLFSCGSSDSVADHRVSGFRPQDPGGTAGQNHRDLLFRPLETEKAVSEQGRFRQQHDTRQSRLHRQFRPLPEKRAPVIMGDEPAMGTPGFPLFPGTPYPSYPYPYSGQGYR